MQVDSITELPLCFSCVKFENRTSVQPIRVKTTWAQFCEQFAEPDRSRGRLSAEQYHQLDLSDPDAKELRSTEKDGAAWSPVIYEAGHQRGNAGVVSFSAFVGDLDDGDVDLESVRSRLHGLEHLIHSTYSHQPEKPKFRFIVPFDKPFPTSEIFKVFDHFNEMFDDKLDPCSKKPAQFFYLPSCPVGAEYLVSHGHGSPARIGSIKTHRELRGHRRKKGKGHTNMPLPCKDGERHEVAMSWIGRLLAKGAQREDILYLLGKWNETNIDKWPKHKLLELVDGITKSDERNHPERHQDAPWSACSIPVGYRLSPLGVCAVEDGKQDEKILAGPVWVSARTRDPKNNEWGIFVEWIDDDKIHHEIAVPSQRLHEANGSLVPELASSGLYVVPGFEKPLIRYLGRYRPTKRLTSVSRLGWLDTSDEQLAYMLPTGVQQRDGAERYVFQPERHSPTAQSIRTQGTLEDWQRHVVTKLKGNPLLLFGACIGFVGPLLKAAQIESGGFHFYGTSSRGKTTIAQIAASVMGSGADPAEAPDRSYIQRWNTTLNGLEGLAAAHNDGVLVLDELQTCGARDFRQVIYNLSGGHGKVAMNANRTLRPPREWRLVFLSTGEISTEQKIDEERHQVSSGQRLRMLDIPIHGGIIQETAGQPPDKFVTELKSACTKYFGNAGLHFVRGLIQRYETSANFQNQIKQDLEAVIATIPSRGLEPEAKRAQKRFALVQVAGELAAALGILPVQGAEIADAVRTARNAWIDGLGHLSEAIRGMEALAEFLLRFRGRFQNANVNDESTFVQESFGYIDTKENIFLLHAAAFQDAIRQCAPREVCGELKRRKLLVTNEPDRNTYKKQIPQLKSRPRFYAVRFALLETDLREAWDDRDHGAFLAETGP
jgi:putative DNA primase/helicase